MVDDKEEKQGVIKRCGFPFIFLILLFFSSPSLLLAQVQITGLIELESDFTRSISETPLTEITSKNRLISQRYQIGIGGIILDSRFASYSGTIGLQDSTWKNESFSGITTKVNRDTLTYSLQMSLFPTRWPMVLFAQRNVIGTEAAGDLIADTLSANWLLNSKNLPTLRVTLLQLGSEFQDPSDPRETRVRIANLGLNQHWKQTSLDINYQLSDYFVKTVSGASSSTVSSFTLRGESTLEQGLFTHAHMTYFPSGSVFAPGLSSTSETAGGVGLLHQLRNFSQSANFEYFDNSGTDVQRNILSYNVGFRPLGKTDYHGDMLYASTVSPLNDTSDYRIGGGLNHRPFFGLSLTAGLNVNHIGTSGQTTSAMDRMVTNAGASYFKPLTYFNFNSGLGTDYSIVQSDQVDVDGQVWAQTLTLGLSTRTLKRTQVIGSYSFLYRENNIVNTDNRKEHALHLGVLDTTISRLILKLNSDLDFTDSFGVHGKTFVLDARADYFLWRSLDLSAGYRHSDFPKFSGTQDVSTYLLEGRYFLLLTRNLNLSFSAHWDRDSYAFLERDRYQYTSLLGYQLGKITTSLEYRNEVTKYPQSQYTVESVFLRVSRPF